MGVFCVNSLLTNFVLLFELIVSVYVSLKIKPCHAMPCHAKSVKQFSANSFS